MKTIAWLEKARFAEAVSFGFEYALLGKNLTPLHAPVQCKDFFNDTFWSEATGEPAKIYGFEWKPGMLPKAKTYSMAVRYNKKDMTEYARALVSFLHPIEKKLDFVLSKVVVDDTGLTAVITFDADWTTKPVLISAFTLLLRVGCTFPGGSIPEYLAAFGAGKVKALAGCDTSYVNRALARLTEIVGGKSNFAQKYSDYTTSTISALHHSAGVVNWKG